MAFDYKKEYKMCIRDRNIIEKPEPEDTPFYINNGTVNVGNTNGKVILQTFSLESLVRVAEVFQGKVPMCFLLWKGTGATDLTYDCLLYTSWQAGTFWFPAVVALIIVVIAYSLIRDTPQSCGLPPIEEYRNDYPKNYSAKSEVELTAKEIFFKYVLNNKTLWFIALANAFIYLIRYGVLDWAPTYLKEVKGYDITEIGWAYFV